jgi:hypothetical protein
MGKPVPSYWWDFEWINGKLTGIMIESSDDRFPVVTRLPFTSGWSKQAEKILDDLRAGRRDPRRFTNVAK